MCKSPKGGDGGAAAREAERQAKITEGYNTIQNVFGGFNDDFYNARGTAYTEYAAPQLDDQYQEAVKQLTYALSRNGQLDSSVAGEQQQKLQKQYDQQKLSLSDKALQYGNDARSAVERSRSDLVSLNSNLANPQTIATEAQGRLAGLQAMPTFSPLAPLFTNASEALGTQADLERRSSAKYNTGIFTPSPVSSGESSGRYIS
jgi:hypothetical protein